MFSPFSYYIIFIPHLYYIIILFIKREKRKKETVFLSEQINVLHILCRYRHIFLGLCLRREGILLNKGDPRAENSPQTNKLFDVQIVNLRKCRSVTQSHFFAVHPIAVLSAPTHKPCPWRAGGASELISPPATTLTTKSKSNQGHKDFG